MPATPAGRTPRLPWILLGVGLSAAVELLAGTALVAVGSVRSATSDVHVMASPEAVRLTGAPGWRVGTCLARRQDVPCSEAHDAEVVAVVAASPDRRDARRRWGANSSCAREVAAVVAAGGLAPDTVTYASAYPGDGLRLRDPRVFCLLVAADPSSMLGSWTGGDLQGPHAPLPLE